MILSESGKKRNLSLSFSPFGFARYENTRLHLLQLIFISTILFSLRRKSTGRGRTVLLVEAAAWNDNLHSPFPVLGVILRRVCSYVLPPHLTWGDTHYWINRAFVREGEKNIIMMTSNLQVNRKTRSVCTPAVILFLIKVEREKHFPP